MHETRTKSFVSVFFTGIEFLFYSQNLLLVPSSPGLPSRPTGPEGPTDPMSPAGPGNPGSPGGPTQNYEGMWNEHLMQLTV